MKESGHNLVCEIREWSRGGNRLWGPRILYRSTNCSYGSTTYTPHQAPRPFPTNSEAVIAPGPFVRSDFRGLGPSRYFIWITFSIVEVKFALQRRGEEITHIKKNWKSKSLSTETRWGRRIPFAHFFPSSNVSYDNIRQRDAANGPGANSRYPRVYIISAQAEAVWGWWGGSRKSIKKGF